MRQKMAATGCLNTIFQGVPWQCATPFSAQPVKGLSNRWTKNEDIFDIVGMKNSMFTRYRFVTITIFWVEVTCAQHTCFHGVFLLCGWPLVHWLSCALAGRSQRGGHVDKQSSEKRERNTKKKTSNGTVRTHHGPPKVLEMFLVETIFCMLFWSNFGRWVSKDKKYTNIWLA